MVSQEKLEYNSNPNLNSSYTDACIRNKIKPTQCFSGSDKYITINEELAHKLSYYKMTEDERKIWDQLCERIRLYIIALQIPEGYESLISDGLKTNIYYTKNCGYNKEYGYYYVEFGDRGSLYLLLLSKDINDALWYTLERIINNISMKEAQNNEKINESNWKYKTKFDYRKYWFEYEIKALSQIVDSEFLKDYINNRLHSMNWWFNDSHWGFDYNKMELIEISDSIERDTIDGSNK